MSDFCNVKFAMLGQIENPSKGFENVIRTHFVLKKDKVLESVREWKKMAEEKDATYIGLVADHNPSYCDRFRQKNTAYLEELTTAIEKLEKALNVLEMPSVDALLGSKTGSLRMGKEKKEKIALTDGQGKIEDVDMTYDENIQLKSMTTDEAGVKDRWSRYIGVMGMESVAKQANASVFLSGMNSLGVEVAKNIVLSGTKRLTLHDDKLADYKDLAGQFFLTEADIGKNRAQATLNKIQQLNFYVKVDIGFKNEPLKADTPSLEPLKEYDVIVLIDAAHPVIEVVSRICREHNRALIVADCHGVFSRVFCDFGPKFSCLDKNGEEAQEVMVLNISNEEKGKVTLLEGVKHSFEDGDTVILRKVDGMKTLPATEMTEGLKDQPESINEVPFKVKVINYNSFYIGDTRGFEPYIRGGLVKQIKIPFDVEFKPYHDIYSTEKPLFEPNLEFHDFMKIDHPRILHLAYLTLAEFTSTKRHLPRPYNLADAKEFYHIALKKAQSLGADFIKVEEKASILKKLLSMFALTCQGNFGPQSAFIGGVVCQEIIKAITGKFKPIVQTLYADSIEVLENDLFSENIDSITEEKYQKLVDKFGVQQNNDRDDGIRLIVGNEVLQKIKYASLFMVGSGAIGCRAA